MSGLTALTSVSSHIQSISSDILLQAVSIYIQTLLTLLSQFSPIFPGLPTQEGVVSELMRNISEEPIVQRLTLAFPEL